MKSRSPLRRSALPVIVVVLLLAASPAGSRPDGKSAVNYEPLKETLSALIRKEMRKNDVTGLSLVLVDDQQVVWAQGFGYADEKRKVPASADTVYRIGTMTKLFTVAAALQLVDRGWLDLDQPLQNCLPDFSIRTRFPNHGTSPVTLRQLMTHHAGLPSNLQKGMWSSKPEPFTNVVGFLKDEYAAYPPGFIFSYSNVGATLLGHVVQNVSGQEYTAFLRESLLAPLGMTRSGFSPNGDDTLSRAYRKGEEITDPLLRDVPAGGMSSTVLDLGRFMAMLFAGGRSNNRSVLRPETVAEMLRPQNANVPLDLGMRVGLGWMLGGLGGIDIQNAGPVAHYTGATLLFHSELIVLPEHKLGVAILTNSSSSPQVAARTAVQAITLALEAKTGIKQPVPKKNVEVDSALPQEVVREYAGPYASLAGFAEITPKSRHFHAEVLNRTFQLMPHAEGRFGVKYLLFGLFDISLGDLDYYELSRATIAGHELLKATAKGRDFLIAEKIKPLPVPEAWMKRVGAYVIANLGDDAPLAENIRLGFDEGFLLAECSVPFFAKGTFRYPLLPVSDTELIVAGLGRGMGETIRAVRVDGKEALQYSGYLLKRRE